MTQILSFNLFQADVYIMIYGCLFLMEAKFIVTEDRHFQILKEIDFPKIDIITLDEIIKII